MMKKNYKLIYHTFFADRMQLLAQQVRKLYKLLPKEEYIKHQAVKIYKRLGNALEQIIPENPNRPEYRLKRRLSLFKRFKTGLQRYRLIFCNSNTPPVIAYLYINDEDHLRKEGSKNDPYVEFETLLDRGIFSSDPNDPEMQHWFTDEIKLSELA